MGINQGRLDKDVVDPPSFAIHADRNVVCLHDAGELFIGEYITEIENKKLWNALVPLQHVAPTRLVRMVDFSGY